MRFPLSWLSDWIELPSDFSVLSELLIRIGVGLEAVENPGAGLQHVVVARIVKRNKHPNADKLSVCSVFDGSRELQIVCGAQNFKEGDLVPLATEGAVLPGGLKIKRSKIRDVESFGMLCSSEELGLGKGVDGLLILSPGLEPGMHLAEALELDDPILTLETTANRADHLSIRGLAREISAVTGKPVKYPDVQMSEELAGPKLELYVKESAACPLYRARHMTGVKVGPSPQWLQKRVEAAGIRSVNNVVDVTNFVMIEYGQPLHAFDEGRLNGRSVRVRYAAAGEVLETLDHRLRTLAPDDLVISDTQGPVALAGVMGGAATEVSSRSSDLWIEAAVFDPGVVRNAARRHVLRSESSLRFERGVDPKGTGEALERAVALIQQIGGGTVMPGMYTSGTPDAPSHKITVDARRLNSLLGSSFTESEIMELLSRRGFKVTKIGAALSVEVPSWRKDVSIPADLAEEVAHLAGLDKMPSTVLAESYMPESDSQEWSNGWKLKYILAGLGLREAAALSFSDAQTASAWSSLERSVPLSNPWSEESSLLRTSLLPNLVGCASDSIKRRSSGISVFELGHIFSRTGTEINEGTSIAILMSGHSDAGNWANPPRAYDYYDLKGVAEKLAEGLGASLRIAPSVEIPAFFHPGQCASIRINSMEGWMGALHPRIAKPLDFRDPVYVLEFYDWSRKEIGARSKFQAFSRLPSIERDLSCLVDIPFEAASLLDALKKLGAFSTSQIRLKDVFVGPPLPTGKKNLTVSLTYLAEEQTLTDEEVNARFDGLCKKLLASLPLEIRR